MTEALSGDTQSHKLNEARLAVELNMPYDQWRDALLYREFIGAEREAAKWRPVCWWFFGAGVLTGALLTAVLV